MTTAALSVTLTKHGQIDPQPTTTKLVFTGVQPASQIALHILCETFSYRDVHQIETTDGTNVTIIHSSQLPAERLRRRMHDIASSLCSGVQLDIISTSCASVTALGTVALRGTR